MWRAETVHIPDVLATLDELTIAVLVVAIPRPGPPPRWAPGVAWTLAAASLVGAMLGASGPH